MAVSHKQDALVIGRAIQRLVAADHIPEAALSLERDEVVKARALQVQRPEGERCMEVLKSMSMRKDVLKGDVAAMSADSYLAPNTPDVFVDLYTQVSLISRLQLNTVPPDTRILPVELMPSAAAVAEGNGFPLSKFKFGTPVNLQQLRRVGAAIVRTAELVKSASEEALRTIAGDLVAAVNANESFLFLNPDTSGSVLKDAPSFDGSGTVAGFDADFTRLVQMVSNVLRGKRGAAVCAPSTALALSLARGDGGSLLYPAMSINGGNIAGVQVLVSDSCTIDASPATAIFALLSPSDIYYASAGPFEMMTTNQASIEQDDSPSVDATVPTGASRTMSLFQTNAVGIRASHLANWHAVEGAAAYFTTGF